MALEQNNRYAIDVNGPLVQQGMGTLLVQGDQYANIIRVELMDGDEMANISGTTETVVIRPDGSEVTIGGSISGNVIETTLQGSCYEIPGMCEIMIRVKESAGNVLRTVLLLTARIMHAEGYQPEGGGGSSGTRLQSKTVSPTESSQTVRPDSGYNGLSYVTINPISKDYVGSSVERKAAQTYTPGTTDQIIEAGRYLNGEQTIKGDQNLLPKNIKSGANIFGVPGSYAGESIRLQEKTATPSQNEQTIQPDSEYNGLSAVVIQGDSNLIPFNIKSGVNIFGVNGTYTGAGGGSSAPQIKTGSLHIESHGSARVNCGFKPDLLIVYGDGVTDEDGTKYESNLVFSFAHKRLAGTGSFDDYLESSAFSDAYYMLDGYALESSSGFDITMWEVSGGWDWTVIANKNFDYVAVKYT